MFERVDICALIGNIMPYAQILKYSIGLLNLNNFCIFLHYVKKLNS